MTPITAHAYQRAKQRLGMDKDEFDEFCRVALASSPDSSRLYRYPRTGKLCIRHRWGWGCIIISSEPAPTVVTVVLSPRAKRRDAKAWAWRQLGK